MVRFIKPEEVLPLRSIVLRNGLPLAQCTFPTDYQGFHLGSENESGKLVSIASLFAEDYPSMNKGGFRLRGRASDPDFAGKGYGAELVKFAIDKLRSDNASYIWCSARLAAVGFYAKLGFKIVSDEFEIPGIGPHFNMLIELK